MTRLARPGARHRRLRVSAAAAGMLLLLLGCASAGAAGPAPVPEPRPPDCVGAAALPNHCPVAKRGPMHPDPASANADHVGDGEAEGCWTDVEFRNFKTCTFGRPDARYSVALVGNSHAAQYLVTLEGWAERHDLRVVTYLIPKCFATDELIGIGDAARNQRCHAWGEWAQRRTIESRPDLIVTGERTYFRPPHPGPNGDYATWKAGYASYLKRWTKAGLHVLVIRDNPVSGKSVPACLQQHPNDFAACAGSRARWLRPDPLVAAARVLRSALMRVVDLSDYMCTAVSCPPVLGGICVYRDHSHLTGTWLRSLQHYLEGPLVRALHHS